MLPIQYANFTPEELAQVAAELRAESALIARTAQEELAAIVAEQEALAAEIDRAERELDARETRFDMEALRRREIDDVFTSLSSSRPAAVNENSPLTELDFIILARRVAWALHDNFDGRSAEDASAPSIEESRRIPQRPRTIFPSPEEMRIRTAQVLGTFIGWNLESDSHLTDNEVASLNSAWEHINLGQGLESSFDIELQVMLDDAFGTFITDNVRNNVEAASRTASGRELISDQDAAYARRQANAVLDMVRGRVSPRGTVAPPATVFSSVSAVAAPEARRIRRPSPYGRDPDILDGVAPRGVARRD